MRFTIYDPIVVYYRLNRGKSLPDGKPHKLIRKWYNDKIVELTKLGFKENKRADVTGGDHDFIVIDHTNKQWCWWENGFYPFCNALALPLNHSLEYWANQRYIIRNMW